MNRSVSSAFGGKAINLFELQLIPGVVVPPFVCFTADMSTIECREGIQKFLETHPVSQVAVRSSASHEDSSSASFAGVYSTLLHVPAKVEMVLDAIDKVRQSGASKTEVIRHYLKGKSIKGSVDSVAVIVQAMIDSKVSGVILSHSLSARDGYYAVSMIEGVGDSMMSGSVNGRSLHVVRSIRLEKIEDPFLALLIDTMRTIENHYGNASLDVEFAFANETLGRYPFS